jgi:hypothetical protein
VRRSSTGSPSASERDPPDRRQLDARRVALRLGLRAERRHAGLAATPRVAIVRAQQERARLPDEDAAAVLRVDESVGLEDRDRLARGVARDAVRARQLAFGRQQRARHELADEDRVAQLLRDAPARRQLTPLTAGTPRGDHAATLLAYARVAADCRIGPRAMGHLVMFSDTKASGGLAIDDVRKAREFSSARPGWPEPYVSCRRVNF